MAEDEGWWEPMRQTMLREQTERAMKAEAALQEAKETLQWIANAPLDEEWPLPGGATQALVDAARAALAGGGSSS